MCCGSVLGLEGAARRPFELFSFRLSVGPVSPRDFCDCEKVQTMTFRSLSSAFFIPLLEVSLASRLDFRCFNSYLNLVALGFSPCTHNISSAKVLKVDAIWPRISPPPHSYEPDTFFLQSGSLASFAGFPTVQTRSTKSV